MLLLMCVFILDQETAYGGVVDARVIVSYAIKELFGVVQQLVCDDLTELAIEVLEVVFDHRFALLLYTCLFFVGQGTVPFQL